MYPQKKKKSQVLWITTLIFGIIWTVNQLLRKYITHDLSRRLIFLARSSRHDFKNHSAEIWKLGGRENHESVQSAKEEGEGEGKWERKEPTHKHETLVKNGENLTRPHAMSVVEPDGRCTFFTRDAGAAGCCFWRIFWTRGGDVWKFSWKIKLCHPNIFNDCYIMYRFVLMGFCEILKVNLHFLINLGHCL